MGPGSSIRLGRARNQIHWNGWFQGAGASDRANQLDLLAQQGGQLVLVWQDQSRLVIIADAHFEYERFYQVRYHITCEVVSYDGTSGGAATPTQTLDQNVASDQTQAQSITTSPGGPGIGGSEGAMAAQQASLAVPVAAYGFAGGPV